MDYGPWGKSDHCLSKLFWKQRQKQCWAHKINDGIRPVHADNVHNDGDHEHDAVAGDISISVWVTKAEMVSRPVFARKPPLL